MIKDIIDRIMSNIVEVKGGVIDSRTIQTFWISRYLVTEGEWLSIMGNNPNEFRVHPILPVGSESYEEDDQNDNDAQAKWLSNFGENIIECWEEMDLPVDPVGWVDLDFFITNLNSLTLGGRFRLPTETEWVYAAKGGEYSLNYPYRSRHYLERHTKMIEKKASSIRNRKGRRLPVGQLKPNLLMLYDMTGNVREWCSDSNGDYKSISMMDQMGPVNGDSRVPKAKGWSSNPIKAKGSFQIEQTLSYLGISCGFRLVFEEYKPLPNSSLNEVIPSVSIGAIDNMVEIPILGDLPHGNITTEALSDQDWNEVIENGISVSIGDFECLVGNLDVDRFRNGHSIYEAQTEYEWIFANTNHLPAWCYYENDQNNRDVFGKLYNWYAITDPRGLAPEGWHIPTEAEWKSIINVLGGRNLAGEKMKSKREWDKFLNLSGNGNNLSRFTGFPGGCRTRNGMFISKKSGGYWWSASASTSDMAWSLLLYRGSNEVYLESYDMGYGFSVRCIRN